jgi:hypothetical protein
MRLLIVTQKVNQNDPILGFFHRWIIEFAKHCESLTVVCLEEGAHELSSRGLLRSQAHGLSMNVKVLSLGKEKELIVSGRKSAVMDKVKYIFRFYKYIWQERENYDAVFVHMNPIYVVLGGLIWKALGKKTSLWYTHSHVDWKLRIAEKLVARIFTASRESLKLASDKAIVTGHGIDTDYFTPIAHREDSDTFRILTAGPCCTR